MKKNTLKKLAKYTAASAAALAGSANANADIIYNDFVPDTTFDLSSSFLFDVDTNGVMDFEFRGFNFGAGALLGFEVESVSSNNANQIIASSFYTPSELSTSAFVSSSQNFYSGLVVLAMEYYGSQVTGIAQNTETYLGFQFERNSQIHYGWMKVELDIQGTGLTIKDYAYEACPLTPIQVGATSGGTACGLLEELSVQPIQEYTEIPLSQITGKETEVLISNVGELGTNDIVLTTNVYKGPDYTTPFMTDTLRNISLDAGNDTTLSAIQFQPDLKGNYFIESIISSDSINDVSSLNDTAFTFTYVYDVYARHRENDYAGSYGWNSGVNFGSVWGQNYTLTNANRLDSISFVLFNTDYHGEEISASIYNTDSTGKPTNIILNTDTIVYDSIQTGYYTTLPINGGSTNLNAGTYYVGLNQSPNAYLGLVSSGSIFTENTVWMKSDSLFGGDFTQAEVIGLPVTFWLTMTLGNCSNTSSTQTVELASGEDIVIDGNTVTTAGTYTETLTNFEGCDSIITYNVSILGSISGNETISTNIYPNPTNGKININSVNENIVSIKVLDIQGKELVIYKNLNAKMNEIDMTSFENGVYFVKIELTNGATEVEKIVKTDK